MSEKKGKLDFEDWGCLLLALLVCGVILTPVIAWWLPALGKLFDWVHSLLH